MKYLGNMESKNELDDFMEFYKEIDAKFGKKMLTAFERTIIEELLRIVKSSSKPITLPDQIRLNKRIATLLVNLGGICSERVKQANMAYRWKKWKRHNEWNPVKAELEKSMTKVLVGDIEQEVSKRTFGQEMVETNMASLADYLTTLHRDVSSYRSALAKQIDYNLREYDLSKHTSQ